MSDSHKHLTEAELSCLSDSERHANQGAHLGGCARCQNAAAEYRWLQDQVGSALRSAAETVPVARPRWGAVRRGMRAERRRRVVGWRASAVGTGVLALCLTLCLSPVLNAAVIQTAFPAKATLPDPSSPSASEPVTLSQATPTPSSSLESSSEAGTTTPILIPLPTPAVEPDT
jgi:anti-sigma factor RsiW